MGIIEKGVTKCIMFLPHVQFSTEQKNNVVLTIDRNILEVPVFRVPTLCHYSSIWWLDKGIHQNGKKDFSFMGECYGIFVELYCL